MLKLRLRNMFYMLIQYRHGVICTSAARFTRWTHGQCKRCARASTSARTNEARDKTEMNPRESRVLQ